MKRIVLTGGGTAGHVTPNLALIPKLKELGYEIYYIGSIEGIERKLIEGAGIPYYPIQTGKFRRYFDLKNFTDPFRVIKGGAEARNILRELRPNIIFSKGGFVSVPVVKAAQKEHIPVIIHESDITPGLANKVSFKTADKICCNFPETLEYLPAAKAVLTGSPIREELFKGSRQAGLSFCGFNEDKPVIMVIGGSMGAAAINNTIRGVLPELLKRYQVVHLCGKGKLDKNAGKYEGYKQFEYIDEELPDIMAMADIVISRAGANSICELLALNKPNILIPLSAKASRGDQILNASSFESQGFSFVLEEENLTNLNLLETIEYVLSNKDRYIKNMSGASQLDAVNKILRLIEETEK
ncbi:MAG: undecaprenyldiphospho-muramoylpentapeptide beta-N-acetylglucosaminyltransferase [Lachnospiraceae bacterium]|jgi:UDP-N-acetylglucosamine--N-acetylmuramyl-(pentapeptide) pyrophosphoryl-undecaprenol N-acetylglucosamine transferase|nr:undecaprenyldiphospho-muramoylpentapeptide beta-N-acetylglucosaminyltransferase [Lachnospiraceae bacterium]